MQLTSTFNVDIELSGGWPFTTLHCQKVDGIVIIIRWRIGPSSVIIVTLVQWLCMSHMRKQGIITNFCIRDTDRAWIQLN